MDIRQIMSAMAVAKFKSFSEAADKLSFSQSAVSKHINGLEEELGIKIFDRKSSPQSVLPTELGKEVLKRLEIIISEYNDLCMMAKNYISNESVPISIGFVPAFGSFGEDVLLADFIINNPDSKIYTVIGRSLWLTELLKSARIDAAVLAVGTTLWPEDKFMEFLEKNNCIAIPLVHSNLSVGISVNHPLANEEKIELTQLKDEVFLLKFEQENPTSTFSPYKNKRFIELCNKMGFMPKIRYVDDYSGKIRSQLVAMGVGVMLNTSCVLQPYKNVKFIPLIPQPYPITGYMIAIKSNTSPNLRKLICSANNISRSNGFKDENILNP